MVKIGDVELCDFPILLAPMEDVTDLPFRFLCKKNGADLVFTEFISSEGLIRNAKRSFEKLYINDEERPIGIQIFGGNMDSMKMSAEIVERYNPDIIDINYGCPVKKVTCKGAGSAILKDIPKMVNLTKEIVNSTNIPVTVKTRLGWDENSIKIVEVAERLQDVGIKAISIHGRTRSQMYKGIADWHRIAEVKNNPRMCIPVFANGDIDTVEKVKEIRDVFGFDGAMIGRASIGYPWFFKEVKHFLKTGLHLKNPTLEERILTVRRHLEMSINLKGEKLGVLEMRRHYSKYFKGIENFKVYRMKLLTIDSPEDIYNLLEDIYLELKG
ncbi:tRNA dihydrouridine synthase DusB [Ichthyobacterium seriolicida]|uniref:tRNA-dihydrouridine synthase n=1 Tax=Ichthyobacterium seriolicida TaxID=242600 RepID=A0A1J1E0E4_9FLAO|nr:tRNA dihydrouridine synthase DusB [Ichthyobacterium seriolicida]BAV94405.1 tRNA dihydrouridine synthase B [Ichthyobacterium seriolicida]